MTFAYEDMYAKIGALYPGHPGEQGLPADAGPSESASGDAVQAGILWITRLVAFCWMKAHVLIIAECFSHSWVLRLSV